MALVGSRIRAPAVLMGAGSRATLLFVYEARDAERAIVEIDFTRSTYDFPAADELSHHRSSSQCLLCRAVSADSARDRGGVACGLRPSGLVRAALQHVHSGLDHQRGPGRELRRAVVPPAHALCAAARHPGSLEGLAPRLARKRQAAGAQARVSCRYPPIRRRALFTLV